LSLPKNSLAALDKTPLKGGRLSPTTGKEMAKYFEVDRVQITIIPTEAMRQALVGVVRDHLRSSELSFLTLMLSFADVGSQYESPAVRSSSDEKMLHPGGSSFSPRPWRRCRPLSRHGRMALGGDRFVISRLLDSREYQRGGQQRFPRLVFVKGSRSIVHALDVSPVEIERQFRGFRGRDLPCCLGSRIDQNTHLIICLFEMTAAQVSPPSRHRPQCAGFPYSDIVSTSPERNPLVINAQGCSLGSCDCGEGSGVNESCR
jgi:hypothetical protein